MRLRSVMVCCTSLEALTACIATVVCAEGTGARGARSVSGCAKWSPAESTRSRRWSLPQRLAGLEQRMGIECQLAVVAAGNCRCAHLPELAVLVKPLEEERVVRKGQRDEARDLLDKAAEDSSVPLRRVLGKALLIGAHTGVNRREGAAHCRQVEVDVIVACLLSRALVHRLDDGRHAGAQRAEQIGE